MGNLFQKRKNKEKTNFWNISTFIMSFDLNSRRVLW